MTISSFVKKISELVGTKISEKDFQKYRENFGEKSPMKTDNSLSRQGFVNSYIKGFKGDELQTIKFRYAGELLKYEIRVSKMTKVQKTA